MKKIVILAFLLASALVSSRVSAAETLQITTASLPDATVGQAYSVQLQATGGVAPYSWATISTTYPSACCGLGVNTDGKFNTQSGSIVYGPNTGTYSWVIEVTDSQGNKATKTFNMRILSDLQITTASLPDATVGKPYSAVLEASGGVAPYSWSPISTTYHAGCCILGINGNGPTFNTQTASTVQGPAGDYSWVLKLTDANGDSVTKTVLLTIKPAIPALAIVTSSLPQATAGQPYSHQLQATGGTTPYSWSTISTTYPAACCILGFNGDSGLFNTQSSSTVSPSYTGTYSWTFQVTDADGNTATKTLNLTINPAASLPTLVLSDSFVSFNYTQGGSPPSHYSAHITNSSNSQSLTYRISVPNQPKWLNTAYATDTLSLGPLGAAGVGILADPTGLAAGTYTTRINFTGSFTNSPASIEISLNVTESAVPVPKVIHPVGSLVNINGTIYKVTPEGLVAFSSPSVFFGNGHSFTDVVPAGTETSKLPVVGSARYPDGTLVNDGGTVYIIANDKKNGFTSAEAFLQLGYRFENVIPDNLNDYPPGDLITSPAQTHPMGTLINDDGTIFLIGENERIGIPGVAVFQSHGYSFAKVVSANNADRGLSHNRNLKFADGSLVNDGGTVYIISQGKKRGFSSASVFLGMGYKFSQVVNAGIADYPSGENF